MPRIFALWLSLLFSLFFSNAVLAQERLVDMDGVSFSIQMIQATANDKSLPPMARVLWLPSEYGVLPQERAIAEQLAKKGIESWFVDFYEAMFLSPTSSAVDEIDPLWTAELIELARADKTLPVWIVAPNKAAQIAVRGLQSIQQTATQNLGLILINPNLYLQTPQPGQVADYWPQSANVDLPITLIQAELSPWKWRLNELNQQLNQAGSDVFTQVIPKVRDRFYFRLDALAVENRQAKQLAKYIQQAMRLQLVYLAKPRTVKALKSTSAKPKKETKSVQLNLYKGQQNLPLKAQGLDGNYFDLKDYAGQVVLVNFWASWCPPCVHEMPSMARLKTHYAGQDVEILAVNLGEEKTQVESFLTEHPVNFPVLLDDDASAVKAWKVFAYPSSYLIDKPGQIRFALFGATEWDDIAHIQKIDALLAE
ncbi:hypothetical protein THMIRHAM_20550 [Thiomicrorhabdus immobilis]|uniref:Thioredoxin domain-containing protein n=1 Tax=Thiomicrorhabdus immobilis TaxID=2791037 RepID=A0ABN6CYR6_9GAMM|nr:TlpA disulfide reductase family protein [Thiomicrorhabdus immobilis]BCN94270.1 hypothetical protein THMIRHAM_20550 [Thiomicrorhabdus immobilis]